MPEREKFREVLEKLISSQRDKNYCEDKEKFYIFVIL
jgi:hypothetical protein